MKRIQLMQPTSGLMQQTSGYVMPKELVPEILEAFGFEDKGNNLWRHEKGDDILTTAQAFDVLCGNILTDVFQSKNKSVLKDYAIESQSAQINQLKEEVERLREEKKEWNEKQRLNNTMQQQLTAAQSLKWVKVGDLFAQAPEVLGNQFEIDFGGNYMMQISNTGGIWRVTNAMDGWGNNCKEKFEESEVLILSSSPLPTTGESLKITSSPLPTTGESLKIMYDCKDEWAERALKAEQTIKELREQLAKFTTPVCTPNAHNLEVLHIGACRECGGTKMVNNVDRPSTPDAASQAPVPSDWKEQVEENCCTVRQACDWVEKHLLSSRVVLTEELVSAYENYIQVLQDELNDTVGAASIHGWQSRNVERGEAARNEVQRLKAALQSPRQKKEGGKG